MFVTTEPNTLEFWEYVYVQNHTKDLDLLRHLHALSVTGDDAHRIAEFVGSELGWKTQPVLSLTGRNPSRGTYIQAHKARGKRGGVRRVKARIVVATPTPVEPLVHELAHHHVDTMIQGETRDHGADFVRVLDKIARLVGEALAIR